MSISVEKRGSSYRARIRRAGLEISKTFSKQGDATAWALANAGAIAGDTYVDRGREKASTLKAILQRYLDEVTPEKKGARTEKARLEDWMRRPWAVLPLSSIVPEPVTEWRNEQQALRKALPP